MINGCLCTFAWWLIYYCANLCWLLWTQVHDSVVRAVDCRSAGPWFDSGWRSWFTFMTCSDNPMNQISQMSISKRPIIRKSVKTLGPFFSLVYVFIFSFSFSFSISFHAFPFFPLFFLFSFFIPLFFFFKKMFLPFSFCFSFFFSRVPKICGGTPRFLGKKCTF